MTPKEWKGVAVASLFTGIVLLSAGPEAGAILGLSSARWYLVMTLLVGLGPGLSILGLGFQRLHERNLVADTPTSKIRSMALGLVEIEGVAKPAADTFRAPFSDEQCLLYTYKVEEYKQQGKHKSWVTIDEGKRAAPFYVDDGTGQVLVAPDEARLNLPEERTVHVGGGEKPPEVVQRFIDQSEEVDVERKELDLKLFTLELGNRRRYTQHILKPDAEVYVFGKALSDSKEPFIASDASTPMFLISDEVEDDLLDSWTRWGWISIATGGIWTVGALLFLSPFF